MVHAATLLCILLFDATGLQGLEQFADSVHASGRGLILCGAPDRPAQLMRRADFEEHIGKDNICRNIAEALRRAQRLYEHESERLPILVAATN